MFDRKYLYEIEGNGPVIARIVQDPEGNEDTYVIELSCDSEYLYTSEALELVAREALKDYQGSAWEAEDFACVCHTAIELVAHLEQGKSLQSFVTRYPSVNLTYEQEQDCDPEISH